MKVRRYFAANMRSALEMVREEQGPDVLILSNRKVKGGIELVTGDGEMDEALVRKFAQRAKAETATTTRDPKPRGETRRPQPAKKNYEPVTEERLTNETGASLWSDESMVAAMRRELSGMKGLLERQLSGLAWSDFDSRHPVQARVLRELSQVGIVPSLGRELAEALPDQVDFEHAWKLTLNALQGRLGVLDDPILKAGGRVTLCGPTGVGKTLLACKLAANYALAHGVDTVALVSTDEQRLGAQQQLKVFGGLLGIPVFAVRSGDDLGACLQRLEDRSLVIIDTAGAPIGDIRLRELVTQMGAPDIGAQNYLVLSASTDYLSLAKVLEDASDLDFDGCVLTKLDEAAVLGPALSALIEAALPIAYLCAGQQVPDDLEAPMARQLIHRAIALAEESPVEADPSAIERAFVN